MAIEAAPHESGVDSGATYQYRAFISYSRADEQLARALQDGLERLGTPRRKPKLFEVFLDVSDLPAAGALPDRLTSALAESEQLIVIISPASVGSKWVAQEITSWLADDRDRQIILVLRSGDLRWTSRGADDPGGWATDSLPSLPKPLHAAFETEPIWLDLTAYEELGPGDAERLTLANSEFEYNVARIQAPLRGPDVRPSDIVSEALDIHRANERRRRRAIIALITLTVAALLAGILATVFALRSAAQEREALSRQLASQSTTSAGSQLDLGLLLAVEAIEVEDGAEPFGRLIDAASRTVDLNALMYHHTAPIRAVAIDGAGDTIATVDNAGQIWLSDRSLRPLGPPLQRSDGDDATITDIEFSPTAAVVVGAGADGRVVRWDISDPAAPAELKPLIAMSESVTLASVDYGPEGDWLVATGGLSAQGTCETTLLYPIVRVDVESGAITEIGRSSGCATALAVSPDGTVVAVGDSSGTLQLIELERATSTAVSAHGSPISDVAFSADGTRIVSAGRDTDVHVWTTIDLREPELTMTRHEAIVRGIAISDDGVVATSDRDHRIEVWDLESGQRVAELSASHAADVRDVAFVPGTDQLVSAGADRRVVSWNLDRGSGLSEPASRADLRAVTYDSSAGRLVVAGGSTAEAGTPGLLAITRPEGATDDLATESAALAADSRSGVVALGLVDGTVELRSSRDGGLLEEWPGDELDCSAGSDGSPSPIRSIAIARDGTTIAAGYAGGAVVVIDRDESAATRCRRTAGRAWDLAFHPTSPLLIASNGDDWLVRWTLGGDPDGDEIELDRVAAEVARSVAISPDGSTVAVGGSDGDIVLMDAVTGQPRGQPLRGHPSAVTDLAFHPLRPVLASGDVSGSLRIWSTETGLGLAGPLAEHAGALRSMVWLTDDRLATAGPDGSRIWDFSRDGLREKICEAVSRNLTVDEWKAFLGNRSYEPSCSLENESAD